jgi:deoxycytidylate deaminase
MTNKAEKVNARMPGQRDEVFINMAKTIAGLSEDPKTQVGSIIVSKNGSVISAGFNHGPRGNLGGKMNWARRTEGPLLDTKALYVVHAERDAIIKFEGISTELRGATIYTLYFPCSECAREIAESGIARVVYADEDVDKLNGDNDRIAAHRILDSANVICEKIS